MISINTALVNRLASTLAEAFEVGAGDAKLRLYSGTMPGTSDNALTSQVLLVELDLPDDAFDDAFQGEVKRQGAWEGTAVETGTVSFFRLVGGDESYVLQGTVSGANGGGDMQMAKVNLVSGDEVVVSTAIFSFPTSSDEGGEPNVMSLAFNDPENSGLLALL